MALNLKNLGSRVRQMLTDDEGLFQRGQFTPMKAMGQTFQRSVNDQQGLIQKQGNTRYFNPPKPLQTPTRAVWNTVGGINKGLRYAFENVASPYVENRYARPVTNIPNAFNQLIKGDQSRDATFLSSARTRGQGALGLLGGVATFFPDPVQDLAFPIYDAWKGRNAAAIRGGNLKDRLRGAKQGFTGENVPGIGSALTTDPNAAMVGDIAELPLTIGLTMKANKKMSGGWSKEQLEMVQKGFNPEVRKLVGQFSEIVEKNPSTANRKNLGELGEYIQSLAETVFGKEAETLTNKQLKNAFDSIMQVADRRGRGIKEPFSIGLNARDLRDDLKKTQLVMSPKELNIEHSQQLTPRQIQTLNRMFDRIKGNNKDAKINVDFGNKSGTFNSIDEVVKFSNGTPRLKIKPQQINTGAYTAIDPRMGKIRVQDPKQTLSTLMGGTTNPKLSNAQQRARIGSETDPFLRELEEYQNRGVGMPPPPGTPPPRGRSNPPPRSNKPIVDYDTAITTWRGKDLAADQRANAEIGTFKNIPEEKGMEFILKTEEGVSTPEHQKLRDIYNSMRQEGLDAGLDVKFIDNYINHVWKNSPKEIFEMMDEKLKGIGKTPAFVKERRIPTYKEGLDAGLVPEFTHPDQLVAHYRRQLERAKAAKELSDNLYRSGQIKEPGSQPFGWKVIDAPLVPDIDGKYAEKRIAEELSNIFGSNPDNILTRFLDKTAKFSKGMQEVTLSGGVKTLNSFSLGNLIKEFTSGRFVGPVKAFVRSFDEGSSNKYFKENQKYLVQMSEDGIPLYTSNSYKDAYKNIFENKTLKGAFGKQWGEWINDPTFKRFLPMLQVEFYKDALKSGMSRQEAAQATKNFYGVIDNFRRPEYVEDAMSTLFFAPKFRESMINFWRKNANSIGIEGVFSNKGKVKFNPKNLTDKSLSANRKFLIGTVLTYLMYQAANKAITGHWMHENKEGKEFSIEIPVGNGRSWYIPMLPTIGTIPRRVLEMGGELAGGDIAGAGQKAGSFFSQPISLGSQLATNTTFYGGNIYEDDDSALNKVGKTIGYGLGQSVHPFLGEPIDVLQGRKTPLEGVLGALEMPVYPSKSTEVSHLTAKQVEEYNKLGTKDPAKAEEYRLEKLEEKNKPKESEYVVSDDAPTSTLGKVGLYTKSAVLNPVQTYQAVSAGEPIRKVRIPEGGLLKIFDSTTVTERKKDVSELDAGDKSTQVDHKMPKWLGGRETEDNYQRLTNEEHKIKSREEGKIREQYEAGKISRKEAIRQVEELNKKLNPLEFPEAITVESTSSTGKTTKRTINIDEVVNMPEGTTSEKLIKEKKAYALVDDIIKSNLSSNEKANLWKTLGLEEDNVRYYYKANKPNDEKYATVLDEIEKLKDEDLMSYLEKGRYEINNKKFLSDGVIDYLYQDGLITESERKYLKNLEYEYGSKTRKYTKKSTGKKKSTIKISLPKFTPPRMSGGGNIQFSKPQTIKVSDRSRRKNLKLDTRRRTLRIASGSNRIPEIRQPKLTVRL